ncbi:hypothetical protein [Synechococcus sp. CCY 9618]|uniref:hypothetical protein n=1 Tax=Synechococcus sp. CCY 9618 TaxID=2815602 RepID=UPI001C22FC7D|nr:hypothetical protein [Synechococcus sp. CCY 9618]
MPLSSRRPELSNQLLEAIRRRDAATTGRLTRQWVHRHGVGSLAAFRRDTLVAEHGQDTDDWLQGQLDAAPPPPLTPDPPAAGKAPAAPALADAFAALEDAFLPPPLNLPADLPDPAAADGTGQGASALPAASLLRSIPASTQPAPAPATLADLRSWLSGAPQHRRAS